MVAPPRRPDASSAGVLALAILLVALGLAWRASSALTTPLWVDEAESSINGLTILGHGYPDDHYLGLPLYENTLTVAWTGNAELEFRDSSYAARGLAVYHGWLPLYSIAATQAAFGIAPDERRPEPAVRHQGQAMKRTIVPRLPALLFSLLFMVAMFALVRDWAGAPAGLAALAWTALSERAVFFGFQARYYASTLALSAVAALALGSSVRHGRWKDFVLLGAMEALLFHTHQVSALVFALAASLTVPALMRHPQGMQKCLLAVALAALLTVPWSMWSGFLTTAAAVPKVAGLFSGGREWLLFLFERPASLAIFVLVMLVLLAARLDWLQRWPALARPLQQIIPGAAFFITWVAVAYLAVHAVIPAASYFPNRLTLMMQVAGIALVGALIGVAANALSKRWAPGLAVALAIGLLVVSDKLASFRGFAAQEEAFELPVARLLASRTFTPDTRFYASPNDQLLYCYLAGLPVQSIAPIRRSFLETYPGPLVFIESRYVVSDSLEKRIADAATATGLTFDAGQLTGWSEQVWAHHVAAELAARGLEPPALAPLPDLLRPALQHLHAAEAGYIASARRRMPIFRDVDVTTAGDLWLSFSYRFVDYAARLGTKANIHPRLETATIELLPEAPAVIYHCPPLAEIVEENGRTDSATVAAPSLAGATPLNT